MQYRWVDFKVGWPGKWVVKIAVLVSKRPNFKKAYSKIISNLELVYVNSMLFPSEYQPQGTTLSSQSSYIIKNKGFQAQCTAVDANPPPYYIFKQNNVQTQNSTESVYVSDNITEEDAVQVSCVPWNKYGSGPEKKIVLPVIGKCQRH